MVQTLKERYHYVSIDTKNDQIPPAVNLRCLVRAGMVGGGSERTARIHTLNPKPLNI